MHTCKYYSPCVALQFRSVFSVFHTLTCDRQKKLSQTKNFTACYHVCTLSFRLRMHRNSVGFIALEVTSTATNLQLILRDFWGSMNEKSQVIGVTKQIYVELKLPCHMHWVYLLQHISIFHLHPVWQPNRV